MPQSNSMHIHDLLVLGRTVPEDSKKYGRKICMAGYSRQNNQLLRLYPLMLPVAEMSVANQFRARHLYEVELIRNPDDSRMESWRVKDERRPTATPWKDAKELPTDVVCSWLENCVVDSIKTLNKARLSLGVIFVRAGGWKGRFVEKTDTARRDEIRSLFQDLEDHVDRNHEFDPCSFKQAPYIEFEDCEGKHLLQLREWGAYLMLGKNPDNPEDLWQRNGYKQDLDTYIVVGNMASHRNNWLVIKFFQVKPEEPNLFTMLSET